MSLDDEAVPAQGLPGWVMTFADLMTLLMCFYVLMLSFSEMDVAKFKELSGSLRDAFGVQTDLDLRSIPKGTSLIAREFTPGRTTPTSLDTIRQYTVNSNMNTLDIGDMAWLEDFTRREQLARTLTEQLLESLAEQVADQKLLIRQESTNVIIQILEQDSFASGEADIAPSFMPVLDQVAKVIAGMPNAVIVSGHTDNVPIYGERFRSNWDLSAARAASVAHVLLGHGVASERLMVTGHADTQPRASNATAAERAKNRRIDITLLTGRQRHDGWAVAPGASAE